MNNKDQAEIIVIIISIITIIIFDWHVQGKSKSNVKYNISQIYIKLGVNWGLNGAGEEGKGVVRIWIISRQDLEQVSTPLNPSLGD